VIDPLLSGRSAVCVLPRPDGPRTSSAITSASPTRCPAEVADGCQCASVYPGPAILAPGDLMSAHGAAGVAVWSGCGRVAGRDAEPDYCGGYDSGQPRAR
jgi:hypothetical protein